MPDLKIFLGGIIAPIFCPITPDGRLAERWRKLDEDVRVCTTGEVNAKVVEQGGIPIQAILNKPPPDNDDEFPLAPIGGPRSRVCARETLRSAPHQRERKFSAARVCRVTSKHLPKPLRSHIPSF